MIKNNKLVVLLVGLLVGACSSSQLSPAEHKPLPDSDSKGAAVYLEYCSNCHAAPTPTVHLKDEWSNVVYRMNIRRVKRALGEIPEADKSILLEYLQEHARQ